MPAHTAACPPWECPRRRVVGELDVLELMGGADRVEDRTALALADQVGVRPWGCRGPRSRWRPWSSLGDDLVLDHHGAGRQPGRQDRGSAAGRESGRAVCPCDHLAGCRAGSCGGDGAGRGDDQATGQGGLTFVAGRGVEDAPGIRAGGGLLCWCRPRCAVAGPAWPGRPRVRRRTRRVWERRAGGRG
jgi:hypothetical protein